MVVVVVVVVDVVLVVTIGDSGDCGGGCGVTSSDRGGSTLQSEHFMILRTAYKIFMLSCYRLPNFKTFSSNVVVCSSVKVWLTAEFWHVFESFVPSQPSCAYNNMDSFCSNIPIHYIPTDCRSFLPSFSKALLSVGVAVLSETILCMFKSVTV